MNAAIVAVSILVAGCSRNADGRHGVSGTVTFNGQKLDQGTIAFHPESGGANSAGASISNGSYKITAEEGLLPGKYKVAVSSVEGGNEVIELPGDSNVTVKDRIPEKYNAQTELNAEVKPDGNNNFNFDLQ